MDPSDILPYELLEMIWLRLDEEKDLLSCRRVSSSWRESLEASRAWSRWCCSSPDNLESRIFQEQHHSLTTRRRPWEHYLSTKKRSAAWSRGMFQLQTKRRSPGNENDMIHLGKTSVYICSEKGILFYDLELKTELHRYNVEEETGNCKIVTSACGGDDILGVMLRSESGYRLKIFEGLGASGLTELAAVSQLLSAAQGGRGEVVYEERRGELAVWSSDSREVRRLGGPGRGEELAIVCDTLDHWAVLARHPVSRGAGFTVYRRQKSVGADWTAIYTAENRCPLAVVSGGLQSGYRDLLALEYHSAEAFHFTRSILLEGKEKPVVHAINRGNAWLAGHYLLLDCGTMLELRKTTDPPNATVFCLSTPLALFSRGTEDIILINRDGSLHFFRKGRKLYEISLGRQLVTGARYSGDTILLWSLNDTFTLTLTDVDSQLSPSSSLKIIKFA